MRPSITIQYGQTEQYGYDKFVHNLKSDLPTEKSICKRCSTIEYIHKMYIVYFGTIICCLLRFVVKFNSLKFNVPLAPLIYCRILPKFIIILQTQIYAFSKISTGYTLIRYFMKNSSTHFIIRSNFE